MTVLHETVEVARPVEEVFAYISDFTTTEEWDATATSARKLSPGAIAVGTQFEVVCALPVGSVTLLYTMEKLQDNALIVLNGRCAFFEVRDTITLSRTATGTSADARARCRARAVDECTVAFVDATAVDALRRLRSQLGESVFADYDFDTKRYQRVPDALYREQVGILKDAQRRYPELDVYTLDYWDPEDAAGLTAIYAEQQANGQG